MSAFAAHADAALQKRAASKLVRRIAQVGGRVLLALWRDAPASCRTRCVSSRAGRWVDRLVVLIVATWLVRLIAEVGGMVPLAFVGAH